MCAMHWDISKYSNFVLSKLKKMSNFITVVISRSQETDSSFQCTLYCDLCPPPYTYFKNVLCICN